jgi:hypothetical protein
MRHMLLFVWAIIIASKDPKMSKQGPAGKKKKRSGENQGEVMASYNAESWAIYDTKKQKDQLR